MISHHFIQPLIFFLPPGLTSWWCFPLSFYLIYWAFHFKCFWFLWFFPRLSIFLLNFLSKLSNSHPSLVLTSLLHSSVSLSPLWLLLFICKIRILNFFSGISTISISLDLVIEELWNCFAFLYFLCFYSVICVSVGMDSVLSVSYKIFLVSSLLLRAQSTVLLTQEKTYYSNRSNNKTKQI
jgi:hypothetical protein